MLLEALAGEQLGQLPKAGDHGAGESRAALAARKTGKKLKKGEAPPKTGKTIQLVRAAAINDVILGLQYLFRAAKTYPKHFVASLELIHKVLDSDDNAAAGTRQTLFVLAGDYHDQRQVHVHQREGPESAPTFTTRRTPAQRGERDRHARGAGRMKTCPAASRRTSSAATRRRRLVWRGVVG